MDVLRTIFLILISLIGFPATTMAAETFKDCSACPTMVKLQPGTYMMGSAENDDEGTDDERPQHKVTIAKPFAIGQYPVTRAEFAAFVQETGHDPIGCLLPPTKIVLNQWLSWRNPGFAQTDRHPVVCVSFEDAQLYVRWLSRKTGKSYRLPSEAEWEFAARAGTTTARYWGGLKDRACSFANTMDLTTAEAFKLNASEMDLSPCRDGHVYTAPVGSFRPNAFGLYDMLGNVWQWVDDCYFYDYTDAPSDGSTWKKSDDECFKRVLRGGSWYGAVSEVRSAYRNGEPPGVRDLVNGIRVARSF